MLKVIKDSDDVLLLGTARSRAVELLGLLTLALGLFGCGLVFTLPAILDEPSAIYENMSAIVATLVLSAALMAVGGYVVYWRTFWTLVRRGEALKLSRTFLPEIRWQKGQIREVELKIPENYNKGPCSCMIVFAVGKRRRLRLANNTVARDVAEKIARFFEVSLDETVAPARGSIAAGIGILLLLHFVAVGISYAIDLIVVGYLGWWVPVIIGLAQLVYVIPGVWIFRSRGKVQTAQGMLIGAGITFLLNGAYWGVVWYIFKDLMLI